MQIRKTFVTDMTQEAKSKDFFYMLALKVSSTINESGPTKVHFNLQCQGEKLA